MKHYLFVAACLTVCVVSFAQTDSLKTNQKKERKVNLYGEVYVAGSVDYVDCVIFPLNLRGG